MRALLLVLPLLCGCTSMKLKDYSSFKDWYWYSGYSKGIAPQERPALYGHFRTPELILQPAGGLKMPAFREMSGQRTPTYTEHGTVEAGGRQRPYTATWQGEPEYFETPAIPRGHYDGPAVTSLALEGGALDLIPYRLWSADNLDIDEKILMTPAHPIMVGVGLFFIAPFRAVALVSHDVYKTLMIPVAYAYYDK